MQVLWRVSIVNNFDSPIAGTRRFPNVIATDFWHFKFAATLIFNRALLTDRPRCSNLNAFEYLGARRSAARKSETTTASSRMH